MPINQLNNTWKMQLKERAPEFRKKQRVSIVGTNEF
jgi:hypothetical protein